MPAVSPSQLFSGYQLLAATDPAPSQGIFIPLASLVDLTPVEAAAATGDGRKVMFALLKEIQDQVTALPEGTKPTKMTLTKGIPVGINNTTIRQSITLNFDLDTTAIDLSSEV